MTSFTSLSSLALDAFYEVARAGQFSKAAKALSITQSALSQRVAKLEDELKTTLIVRDPSGLRLTPAGEELLGYCRIRQGLEREFVDRVRAGGGQAAQAMPLSGLIRVVGYATVMRSAVLPPLFDLAREHPDIALETFTRELHEVPRMLRSGEADFALLDHAPDSDQWESVLLGHERYVLVGAQAKSLKLAEQTYIDHDPADAITLRYLALNGVPRASRIRRVFLDETYSILDAAAAGLGLAVVPVHLIESRGDLARVPGLRPMEVPVHLVYPKQAYYTALQKAVLGAIRAGAGKLLARVSED